jgi:CBS domain-containing protein
MLSNKVREIMTTDVFAVEATLSISEVMETMAAKDVGRILITKNGKPAGIFTEKDVLKRVMNKNLDSRKTPVAQVMTPRLQTVAEDTHILEALGKMYRGKFRHLLVRSAKGDIVGLMSMRRILKLAVELGRGLVDTKTVGSIMSGGPLTVETTQSVHDAIEMMVKKDVVCVVVTEHGAPKGIFTERDILRRVAVKNLDARNSPIETVMTRDLVTAPESAYVGQVLEEMYKGDFRNMPILGQQKNLVGIVSMGEVLQFARAFNIDEEVRKTWKEIEDFWKSEEHYTPG